MDHVITICGRYLSDLSEVYDVKFGGLVLPAVTGQDAESLAAKIVAAVAEHTNETVTVAYQGMAR